MALSAWFATAARAWFACSAFTLILAATGCGSDEGAPATATSPANLAQPAVSGTEFEVVVNPDVAFTIDQLVAAGWKQSKQLAVESLPGALDVWYGFYDRKDIEVRVYRSHPDANGPGAEAAREAIGRSPNSNIGGGIITTSGNRTQYHAYVVAGNLVLLCEQTTDPCLRLIKQARR